MDNNNETNIPKKDDFEIIDIPTEFESQQPIQSVDTEQETEMENPVFGTEMMAEQPTQQSFTEMPQPTEEMPQQLNVDSTSYNEISDSNEMNNEQRVYIPKKEVKPSEEPIKEKMDKSIKEMIAMGIIIAIVIILLPVLYNLSVGKYHVMNKIQGLFNKEETQEVESTEETETVKNEIEEENTSDLSFDFSNYNNKVLKTSEIKELVTNYQNNLILLQSEIQNNVQVITISLASDMENVQTTITDPETTVQDFGSKYLAAESNYLSTVKNNDDGTVTITITQQ